SDLVVIDVSDPTQPDSCNFYGGGSNSIATWGVNSYQNKIFLSYICALVPFSSNWTGVKILTFTPCSANSIEEKVNNRFSISPNPAQNSITLNSENWVNKSDAKVNITNIMGEILIQSSLLSSSTSIDISSIPQGLYMVQIENGTNYVQKFIKQ
ncbi:MAG TPA: T9SS type A sorting domain-containing protein, partial [Flavobacteriales bacterium]|nr:T9SS type A sorting domain-containing protein [Flavobacteriales bacterium]